MKIDFVIDRFENNDAILLNGQNKIIWPKKLLPANTGEGNSVSFEINHLNDQDSKNQQLAKDILNEILGN